MAPDPADAPDEVAGSKCDLLQQQAVQILQPALGGVGGILEAKKIASVAEAHYAQFAPHLFAGPIEAAANIQRSVRQTRI